MILTDRQKRLVLQFQRFQKIYQNGFIFSKDTQQFEGILDSIEIGVLGVKIDENRIALTS